jgi:hypothetical protein
MRRVRSVLPLVAALLVAVLVSPFAPIVEAKGPPPHAGKPPCRPAKSCETAPTTTLAAPAAPASSTTTTTTSTTTTTAAPTTTTTLAPVAAPTATALWHANADGDVDEGDGTLFWNKDITSGNMARLSIGSDPTGRYGKVYRAHLSAAEIDSGENRAEFAQALLGDGSTKLRLGVDGTRNVWFGWRSLFGGDILVDPDHDNDGNYMQIKGDSSCGGPAIGLTIKYGHLTLRSEQYLEATDGIAWNGPSMSSLLDGRWHSFTLHVQFAKDSSGYLEVWLDGAPQTMTNGATRIYFPTLCPNDSYAYPKMGVYGMDEGIGNGPDHWIESPRIGSTYESVVPR